MSSGAPDYRIDGIYRQRQEEYYMQRVKLPAGVISATQAGAVASVAADFGRGLIHLTSRGSMEIHWLREQDLQQVKRRLAMAGLTSRGACGGAVRGITCGSQGGAGFPILESLARRLHRHFTGNPRFERLPKKFKIGIEADDSSGRHLIQDVGIVLSRTGGGFPLFDVWIAGGLGREPRPGFLLTQAVPEERLIPVIEAVIAVYAAHAPAPKRLKFLAREWGEGVLRERIESEPVYKGEVPAFSGYPENIFSAGSESRKLRLPVFAGMLKTEQLESIARFADRYADGVLMVSVDQDILLHVSQGSMADGLEEQLLEAAGLPVGNDAPVIRVCPGSHECRMGLAPTREVADRILASGGGAHSTFTWALSGCQNSCTQPQLADVGIVCTALVKGDGGVRTPVFDLYRRTDGNGFGRIIAPSLPLEKLLDVLQDIR